MGAVRRPCPQPQQRIVRIRSEEPPKNRAQSLGPIGQSSWRYLPDYTRHLWPIKDELGTATWLVKGRREGAGRIISRHLARFTGLGYRRCGRESCEPAVADRTGLTDRCACTAPLFESSADRMSGSAAEEGNTICCSGLRFLAWRH